MKKKDKEKEIIILKSRRGGIMAGYNMSLIFKRLMEEIKKKTIMKIKEWFRDKLSKWLYKDVVHKVEYSEYKIIKLIDNRVIDKHILTLKNRDAILEDAKKSIISGFVEDIINNNLAVIVEYDDPYSGNKKIHVMLKIAKPPTE